MAPAAFLAAVTIAVAGVRVLAPHHHGAHATPPAAATTHRPKPAAAGPRYYRVRAGDTLAAIAARTKTPPAVLRRLNPTVQPTALFIGQRLRLR